MIPQATARPEQSRRWRPVPTIRWDRRAPVRGRLPWESRPPPLHRQPLPEAYGLRLSAAAAKGDRRRAPTTHAARSHPGVWARSERLAARRAKRGGAMPDRTCLAAREVRQKKTIRQPKGPATRRQQPRGTARQAVEPSSSVTRQCGRRWAQRSIMRHCVGSACDQAALSKSGRGRPAWQKRA